jgi:putative MATE family efflux protein
MAEQLYRTLRKAAEGPPRELTSGSTFRHVLRLGLPSMFAMGLQASYDTVDLIWIGRTQSPPSAMSAVTIFGMLYALVIVLSQMVDVGTTTLVSRYYGAKRFDAARLVAAQAWSLKFMLSLPAGVLGAVFAADIFRLVGAEPDVVTLGNQYSVIMLLGLPLFFWGLTLNTAFRAAGDARKPLYMAGISIGVNIALDPLLIFGVGPFPELGVRGAAIASVFCQALFTAMGLYYLLGRRSHLRVSLRQLVIPRVGWAIKMLRIGLPAAVGDLLRTAVLIFTALVVLKSGKETMAAFGVGSRLFVTVWIPFFAIGTAVSALVGQNLGAKKPDRATRAVINGTFSSLALAMVIGAVGFLIPGLIMRIFTPDPEVIRIGIPLLRIGAFAVVGVAVTTVHASAFWGAGDTLPPMVVWIAATAGVQLPILLLSVLYFDADVSYVWLSIGAGATFAMVLSSIWLARGGWLKKKL